MNPPRSDPPRKSRILFRTGRHNPFALYAGPADGQPRGMYEQAIGFISDERAAQLAADAMTESACLACPWPCVTCTLAEESCECYEHGSDHPDDTGAPEG